jgi:hypothetical protein
MQNSWDSSQSPERQTIPLRKCSIIAINQLVELKFFVWERMATTTDPNDKVCGASYLDYCQIVLGIGNEQALNQCGYKKGRKRKTYEDKMPKMNLHAKHATPEAIDKAEDVEFELIGDRHLLRYCANKI